MKTPDKRLAGFYKQNRSKRGRMEMLYSIIAPATTAAINTFDTPSAPDAAPVGKAAGIVGAVALGAVIFAVGAMTPPVPVPVIKGMSSGREDHVLV